MITHLGCSAWLNVPEFLGTDKNDEALNLKLNMTLPTPAQITDQTLIDSEIPTYYALWKSIKMIKSKNGDQEINTNNGVSPYHIETFPT